MRRNSLRILILAVMFAVTALSAVGFFADRVGRVLSVEGAAAIAADLVIEQVGPIPSAWLEEARRLKLQTSRMVRFPSVLFFGDRPQLVQIKAVDTNYPLRGHCGYVFPPVRVSGLRRQGMLSWDRGWHAR